MNNKSDNALPPSMAHFGWSESPNLYFLSVCLAALTGASYVLLIPLLMYGLNADISYTAGQVPFLNYFNSPTATLAEIFLIGCVGIMLLKAASLWLASYLSQVSIATMRGALYRKIATVPVTVLEEVGYSRLITALNSDVAAVATLSNTIPVIWVQVMTVIGTLMFILWLNAKMLVIVLAAICVAALAYQILMNLAVRFFNRVRDTQDRLQSGLRGLVFGAKELRLSSQKTEGFIATALLRHEQAMVRDSGAGNLAAFIAQCFGEIVCFLVIGVIVFHFRYKYLLKPTDLYPVTLAILYLAGPIAGLLNCGTLFIRARLAWGRLRDLEVKLNLAEPAGYEALPEDWNALRIENLSFSYPDSSRGAGVTNVNLVLRRGEVTFLTGGNGSGKTTLAKCISTHYTPSSGAMYFDEARIESATLGSARERISAIFSDYHVFVGISGWFSHIDQRKARDLVRDMGLVDYVQISEDGFSTSALSDGQRRRLALIAALLDERSIYVFDEWAADQDPAFKETFYRKVLPGLRSENKLVLVISHDDRYFECADQLVHLENGKVAEITRAYHALAPDLRPFVDLAHR